MTSHPDFPEIQRRLKALGLYNAPIDDDWGPGMAGGISKALATIEDARGIKPPPAPKWPKLPVAYEWLRDPKLDPLPRHLSEALNLIGTVELAGAANSPTIMGWRDELNRDGVPIVGYSADSVAWCGLFMAAVMHRAQRDVVDSPLWALNWSKWGEPGGQPELGDLLTFKRDGGGHVALYIAEDTAGYFHVLGGNQSDQVNIMRIAKSRMAACRQPPYINKPASVRPRIVSASGRVSTNEG